MAYETILYEVKDKICTITLNRPENMNSYNNTMSAEINQALKAANEDDGVRAVIFTGAEGCKKPTFCAGFDLTGGKPFDFGEVDVHDVRDTGGTNALSIYEMNKPVIAAMNGSAVGIGITMTLPMDVRILSEDAKIGFVFAKRGFVNEACSSWFLPKIVGISKAVELVMTGRIIKADEALRIGLVTEVVPQNQVYARAVEIAKDSEIAILVCGDNTVSSGEGCDRSRLVLAGRQRELILKVAETGTPVVLVLENGKAVDLSAETPVCASILVAGFGGEFGAKAIVNTLAGDVNPAGRLTVSYPYDEGMIPCYYTRLPGGSCDYLEGPRAPMYPFGFGLSYTKFEYSDLSIKSLGLYRFEVTFTVKNVGDRAGDEVAQLYVNDPESSIVTPEKVLRKFKRVTLEAGEACEIRFELDFDDFKLLNRDWKWVVEPGEFEIMVGASSNDIRLNQTIVVS